MKRRNIFDMLSLSCQKDVRGEFLGGNLKCRSQGYREGIRLRDLELVYVDLMGESGD